MILIVAATTFALVREEFTGRQQIAGLSASILMTAILLKIVITGRIGGSSGEGRTRR